MKCMRMVIAVLVCTLGLVLTAGFGLAEDVPWQGNPSGNIYWDNGNVGIGTSSPIGALHVTSNKMGWGILLANSNASGNGVYIKGGSGTSAALSIEDYQSTPRFVVQGNGNVGIGTTSPSQLLHINASDGVMDNTWLAWFQNNEATDSRNYGLKISAGSNASDSAFFVQDHDASNDYFIIRGNGNVGIGTTSPDNKLDVKGTIRAEEVKVETDWSDFVFEGEYNLPDLKEIESYIKENKHLPDIPSAEEVKEKGLSVADMMAKQMQKIEELTLYVIAQNKKIEGLEKKLAELEERK